MAALGWVGVLLALAPSSAPAGPGAAAPVPRTTAERLDDLHRRIVGTVEERRAAELLDHHRVEGGVAACMAAAGRPYGSPRFISFYADFTDADMGYGTGRATVIDSLTEGGRVLVLNEIAFARREAGRTGRRVAAADVGVLNGCRARFGHRSGYDAEPPPGTYELADSLANVIGPGSAELTAAMDGYRPCMRQRYGHDVTDRSDFLFRPRIDRRDAPVDGRPAPAAWTRGVAEIEAAFAADADCRRPAYEIAMGLVAQRLDGWEQQHRAELDAVRAAWRQRVAQAARLPR